MRKLALVVLIALCSLCFMNFTCSNAQKKAAQAADVFANGITSIHTAVDAAYKAGKISKDDYTAFLQALAEADKDGLQLNSIIAGIGAGTTTSAQINTIVQSIETALANGTAHIKDPATLAEVQTAITGINTTLTTIETIYATGGK